jgi:methylmalonyl-CoA/ethylmalonyl-CoA epimerase
VTSAGVAVTRVHHAAIAVRSLAAAYRVYRDTLGLPLLKEAEVRDQGVRAALLDAGPSEVELLEPLHPDTGVGRFLARHGERLHHVCFDTPDVAAALGDLRRRGVELIDAAPRPGLAGRIAFLHPRACAGLLVELATPPAAAGHAPSPCRLVRVVAASRDPDASAAVLAAVLAVPAHGGRVVVGPSTVQLLPAAIAGGEGLTALGFEVADPGALKARCGRHGLVFGEAGDELVIDARLAHGAELRFRA